MKILKEPAIQDLGERYVAFVSYKGNYIGNTALFAELFGKLCGWGFQNQVMGPDTVMIAAYYDDMNVTPPDELTLDVCMSIPDHVQGQGEITTKNLPGGKYAVMGLELDGPEEYAAAWEKIVEFVASQDLDIDISRASYEIYLNNPEEHPQKHHIVDICMAVR
ncbi:MAG: GyrI-like domain-containing protein [Methanomicrobiales archaeon]|nr:GyrI-like domain-containing protein [Methanomicrobiales archaeon]